LIIQDYECFFGLECREALEEYAKDVEKLAFTLP
jgi:hypothetical protein